MNVQEKAGLKKKNIQSHNTSEEMVKDLLLIIPYSKDDILLDAGSGKNKVFFNNFKCNEKYECEIDEGKDFLKYSKKVDWVIGNPPYHISWSFTEKALSISRKGIAWLINLNNLNSLCSPKRLDYAKSLGFGITKLHILEDKRWFGRYFLLVYEKNKKEILTWTRKKYG